MRNTLLAVVAALTGCMGTAAYAGSAALLEIRTSAKTLEGRVLAHSADQCWILTRDGQLHDVNPKEVRSFRELGRSFQGMSSVEQRDVLRRELGSGFEVVGSEHYLIAAQSGKARDFADLFDGLYRTFHAYFSARGFQLSRPQFPMVAIVFPDHAAFAAYCRQDDIAAAPGLMGYYLPTSNRVALFDPSSKSTAGLDGVRSNDNTFEHLLTGKRESEFAAFARRQWHPSIQSGLADTIVHEATHQVAFNTGLHARLGESPRWVVEGLATVYEAPGVRDGGAGVSTRARLNAERFVWFGNYAKSRRPARSLEAFVAGDQLFARATLDAYSEAWALTFYLLETQPSRYSAYLKRLAARDPLATYPPVERVADFRAVFGRDLVQFEADFLRYLLRLN